MIATILKRKRSKRLEKRIRRIMPEIRSRWAAAITADPEGMRALTGGADFQEMLEELNRMDDYATEAFLDMLEAGLANSNFKETGQ